MICLALALLATPHAQESQDAPREDVAEVDDPLEWRAQAGAELNASSFGILDLGLRRGDRSIELRTDTLDLRWQPSDDLGRRWVGLRAEAGAAGLMISPWEAGAPAPERALTASYLGAEGGRIWYLPEGLYAGYAWAGKAFFFGASAETTIEVPASRGLLTADGLLGWYKPSMHAWLRVGVDATAAIRSPHAHVELRARPQRRLAPELELRLGLAERQDFLTATRLGGLNPYVVPLAGAGWAEWWVEDYVAARLGGGFKGEQLSASVFTDLATFDGASALGLGVKGGASRGPLFIEAAYGYAPFIERQAGVGRSALMFMMGRAWGPRSSSG